ncbi:histone deacetylase 19-like isoform X4 [Malus domestica]|uniref:histone deacetylase 19-like isoform X4 n=1 Tax=Malus domestica TaxID=3750 RepID=UPI0039755F82
MLCLIYPIVFNLQIITPMLAPNNYSNAGNVAWRPASENEEQDDPYERWDPDSDMEVDDECKPLPSRVKKEIVEPEVKDLKQTSENAGSSGYDPAVDEITTGAKALDMGSGSVDEPTVKVEQDTMNKPADQI